MLVFVPVFFFASEYAQISLGLAILGTILVGGLRSRLTSSLVARGVPAAKAHAEASGISQGGSSGGSVASIPHFVRLDFAFATQTVLRVMAAIMAVAAMVALLGLRRGVQEEGASPEEAAASTP